MATTDLYRHFSASGQLLYVGIAKCALKRLAGHERKSAWASEISRIEIEKFPDRESAMVAEQRAIIAEMPLHNVLGARRRYPMDLATESPHPEMLQLRRYLKGMSPAKQVEFATRCGTKISYFRMAISAGRRVGILLAIRMTQESGGVFNAQRLFPRLGLPDWSDPSFPRAS